MCDHTEESRNETQGSGDIYSESEYGTLDVRSVSTCQVNEVLSKARGRNVKILTKSRTVQELDCLNG